MDRKTRDQSLIIVYVTCGSAEEASSLSEGLIRGHLAGCVNIVPIHSVYEWKGKIENQSELLLVIKSLKSRFDDIECFIRENHSYDTPEIVAIDISDSSAKYRDWIIENCGKF